MARGFLCCASVRANDGQGMQAGCKPVPMSGLCAEKGLRCVWPGKICMARPDTEVRYAIRSLSGQTDDDPHHARGTVTLPDLSGYRSDQARVSIPVRSFAAVLVFPDVPLDDPVVVSDTILPLESFTTMVMDPSALKISLVVVLDEDELEPDPEEDDELPVDDVPNRLATELLPTPDREEDIPIPFAQDHEPGPKTGLRRA